MRKRTQLVGFEFGHWKHVQYAAEFMDNALDAIESFQWDQVKTSSKTAFTMDKESALENILANLSTVEEAEEEGEISQQLNGEAKKTLMHEVMGVDTLETIEETEPELIEEEIDTTSLSSKEKRDREKREKIVKKIRLDMEKLINEDVKKIVDDEPLIIIKLKESEAPSVLSDEIGKKNVMRYTFEVFDNGTGMNRPDLRKFGIYLASSKSVKLKQTRGSQGFGSPSAFSDAQNTTGEPIISVSKTQNDIYATATEFFTTSKNEKKYVISPTEVELDFLHGTYIKLSYLNIKYIKGYVDEYIKKTALMNPHVTIIYQVPNEKSIIIRRVNRFPNEPIYALPHPSSANIGDFQDYLTRSEHLTIPAFLQDNFVRMSSKIAKEIVNKAERQLQDDLNLLIVDNFFLNKIKKITDLLNLMRYEKRVWGKSTKPRDQLISYQVESNDLKTSYWDIIEQFNQKNKKKEAIKKKIKSNKNKFAKKDMTSKEEKEIQKVINQYKNDIKKIEKEKDDLKKKLEKIFKDIKEGIIEIKSPDVRKHNEELIKKVLISKTKPIEITREQFDALFLAFKSIKYMSPPTDTAIPIGPSVLENVLIKDYGLKFSANLEDFGIPQENIIPIEYNIKDEKITEYLDENPDLTEEELTEIPVDNEEIFNSNRELLERFNEAGEIESFQNSISNYLPINSVEESLDKVAYESIISDFLTKFSRDDDFISAETRNPTSGKGLAFVVEAALAYGGSLDTPKKSSDVLHRYVNRTPKLRDNAACAITQAVQSVNWKNYKVETFDNGLPKGPLRVIVNVSGPFVHLMFSSQSKNALATDENLMNEIKLALEAIGRKLKTYINRRVQLQKSKQRSSLIVKYIPFFANSLYEIAKNQEQYRSKLRKADLISSLREAIGKKPEKVPKKEEIEKKVPVKKEEVVPEVPIVEATAEAPKISTPTPEEIQPAVKPSPKLVKPAPKPFKPTPKPAKPAAKPTPHKKPAPAKAPTKTVQAALPVLSPKSIYSVLTDEWQSIKHLVLKLKIRDMMDARLLQKHLRQLENEDKVLVDIQGGKRFWKLKA